VSTATRAPDPDPGPGPGPAPIPAGAPAPASLAEALAMRRAADSYLAAADHTGYTTAEQAAALTEMEQCAAIATAAQAWLLGAFTAGQGPAADADASPRTWLIHKTGVTQGAAAGRVGWSRRVQAHPLVAAALAEGGPVSASMGKVICEYTGKLPAADWDKADAILLGVARAGARQHDIARLAAQMYEKSRSASPDEDPGDPGDCGAPDGDSGAPGDGRGDPGGPGMPGAPDGDRDGPDGADDDPDGPGGDRDGPDGADDDPDGFGDGPGGPGGPDDDLDDGFEDRSVRLDTTLGGAGVLYGDLTPDCAALVSTVLDALSARAGAEDTRSKAQRWHDALAEALQRLVAADLLPDRAGAPTRALVHVALAELRSMRGASKLEAQWVARAQQDWAGHRAAASVAGGDGGAWLNGDAARGACCDAIVVPVVTGQVNPAVLCVELAGHGHGQPRGSAAPGPATPAPAPGAAGPQAQGSRTGPAAMEHGTPGPAGQEPVTPGGPLTEHARAMLQRAIIGAAIDLLSGPGGLASALRTGQLGAGLGGPSMPLDVGYSETIPAAIRTAVIRRAGGHCEWPGGCWQPAPACHVHHIIRKADGGRTSVKNCALLCAFHHLVAVHRWGWTLTLNPDGTTTARSPDGTKVLHSHGPPPAETLTA
jgi:hypothetical protein